MKKINILYADEYEDVDIILVPNHIADDIEAVTQEFFDWTKHPYDIPSFMHVNEYGEIASVDTKEFLWWLNTIKCPDGPQSMIVVQHTTFHPEYPVSEF